jgi:hypothetical protein
MGEFAGRDEGAADGLLTVHLPAIQPAWPEAGVIHDVDRNAATATRRRILAEVAAAGQLVAGCHLEFPSVARLVREGRAYRLIPAFWPAEFSNEAAEQGA